MRRKLAAGNWKMNGTGDALAELTALLTAQPDPSCDVLVCLPATLLHRAAEAVRGRYLKIGAQDCHAAASGAHTGDISAAMLIDAGASHVILGHSERRADHGETDAQVRAKAGAAQAAGMTPIVCVGETLSQREAARALDVIAEQLSGSLPDDARFVVAYEPVWAIGTGKVATLDQIAEIHAHMRRLLTARYGDAGQPVPLLYGGSVKAANAAEIFAVPDVDGALVGGASLKAADFAPIVAALSAQ
ncbi:MAG: triose-phosphate isomerase [Pseudooceanicola sp.]|nr:triose-phosphate isomerase [Pseudooceanicola sp.]